MGTWKSCRLEEEVLLINYGLDHHLFRELCASNDSAVPFKPQIKCLETTITRRKAGILVLGFVTLFVFAF